jgi:hypothetical protein
MQEKVINSLSNIETLMVNKLNNTTQKLNVLKNSDHKDVLEYLQRDSESSRGRKRSSNKFKARNKLTNVHSIQSGLLNNPPMQFIHRSSTIDGWGKVPNASFMGDGVTRAPRRSSRSKSKPKRRNFAYVSIVSSQRSALSVMSRSKSVEKPTKRRSPSNISGSSKARLAKKRKE